MQLDIRWPKWWAYALLHSPPSPGPRLLLAVAAFANCLENDERKAPPVAVPLLATPTYIAANTQTHTRTHIHTRTHTHTHTRTHTQHTLSRQNAKRRTRVRNAQIIENSLELWQLPKTEIPCKCDIHSSALIELVAQLIRLAFPACCRQWKPITAKYTWLKSLR